MPTPQVRAQRWLTFGMAGMAVFLVGLAVVHLQNFFFPPTAGEVASNPHAWVLGQPRHVSAYALGVGEEVWFASVLVLGLGMVAFAIGLRRLMPRATNSAAACWLLGMAGVMVLLLDVFPTDPVHPPVTMPGILHDVAAIVSLTLQCSAMVLLTQTGNRNAAWHQVVGASPAWAATATVLSIGWGMLDIMPLVPAYSFGAAVQRGVGVFLVFWMLMVGWRVRWLVTSADARATTVAS